LNALAFVAAARKYKGARWRHRGRRPWALDCVGLLVCAARDAGGPIDDALDYGREPWDDRLRRELRQRFGAPIRTPRQPGDVLLIRWAHGEPSHIAIVGDHPDGGLTLIHAHNLHGVVECSLAGPFLDCVVEAYRPTWGAHVD
jgi:cell wall-associated NlpC family hydrolase